MRELILNFHGLGEAPAHVPPKERPYWCDARAFIRLLQRIDDRHPEAQPRISLTFDDGNASDALVALPELTRRKMTASFFVCAGRIGKAHYLDAAMMRDILAQGMRIGSHGMDHRPWSRISARELDVEIADAKRKLEDTIGLPVEAAAAPFGLYNRRVLSRLRAESFRSVYTSDRGEAQSEDWLKPRETLRAEMLDRDLLDELLAPPPLATKMRRRLGRLYKRLF